MIDKTWIIYGLRESTSNSKYRYVGYTTKSGDERLRLHIRDAKKKTTPVCSWIKSIDFNVSMEVLEECPEGDIEYIFDREIYWINYFRDLQGSLEDKKTPDYLKNYLNGGGSGNIGIPLTDDHKENIRAGVIQHFKENGHKSVYDFWVEKHGVVEADRLLAEMSRKKSELQSGAGNPMFGRTGQDAPCYGRVGDKHPMFGTHHSEEVRARISAKTKGRPKSEVTKIRMSFANHIRFHGTKSKTTCKWCLGADLQTEVEKKEKELSVQKLEGPTKQ